VTSRSPGRRPGASPRRGPRRPPSRGRTRRSARRSRRGGLRDLGEAHRVRNGEVGMPARCRGEARRPPPRPRVFHSPHPGTSPPTGGRRSRTPCRRTRPLPSPRLATSRATSSNVAAPTARSASRRRTPAPGGPTRRAASPPSTDAPVPRLERKRSAVELHPVARVEPQADRGGTETRPRRRSRAAPRAEEAQHPAGPFFFIRRREDRHVQGAGGQRPLDQELEPLGLMSSMFASTSRTRSRPGLPAPGPRDDPQQVGRPGSPGAPAGPDAAHRHHRRRPKERRTPAAGAPSGHTPRPLPRTARRVPQQLERRRPGTGIFPCSDPASPDPPGRGSRTPSAPEVLEQEQPDTVDDRVDRADLVKWTFPTGTPWTFASASPSRSKQEIARRAPRRAGGGAQQGDDVRKAPPWACVRDTLT